ncbi:ATP-binding protein [Achromobacter anxifer]
MPLNKKNRGLRRLNSAFLCALPLALLCAAALYCAHQQVLLRHADLLQLDFPTILRTNAWFFACVLLLLIVALYAAAVLWFWCRRHIVRPAHAARRALAECEALGRTMLATVPCALCALSRANGRLVFSNALALQWLGAGAGQALPDTPDVRRLLRQALEAEEPGDIEAFNAHDGRVLTVAYAPTRYRRQDVVLCAFADISARAEMEHLLGLAKAQADKVYESGAGILSSITREIRMPLYGMLGTLEVLGMTALNQEQRQHVDRIQSASLVLQQLTGDLLDIARIESGQFSQEASAFDPRELVEGAVAAHAPVAEQKGLIIYGSIDASVPDCVCGDAGRIQQILGHLLGNAIKFTESGQVVARLRAQAIPDARLRLDLQVTDSGIGIASAEQARLFEPFHRAAASSQAARGAGLGLGLFLCARLAALMGTRVQVISEPGLGSSFSVSFMLDQAQAPCGPAPRLLGPQARNLLHLRILVVEGNLINQATLHDQLVRLGCHATLASDGAEGLALWNIQPFDLVMTDTDMPGMSGYALARALRAQGVTAPIIGLVTNASRVEEQRCEAAGMEGWLAKPIGLRALRQRLQAYATAPPHAQGVAAAAQRTAAAASRTGAAEVPAKYKAIFLETMDRDITRLETSMRSGDAADVRSLLHRIRGGLAAVHMVHLLRQADDLAAWQRKEGLGGTMPQQIAAFIEQLRGKMRDIETKKNS